MKTDEGRITQGLEYLPEYRAACLPFDGATGHFAFTSADEYLCTAWNGQPVCTIF